MRVILLGWDDVSVVLTDMALLCFGGVFEAFVWKFGSNTTLRISDMVNISNKQPTHT